MREVPAGSRGEVARVDDLDYPIVTAYTWYRRPNKNTVYAVRVWREGGRQRSQFMHSLITGLELVDHEDGDGLNNQQYNLRPATISQNLRNGRAQEVTSIYKGVGLHRGRWRARIYVDGRRLSLGYFADEPAAGRAYDAAAREHFGVFACLNFPESGENPANRGRVPAGR